VKIHARSAGEIRRGGRTFYEVLANLAVERGPVRDNFSWLHTNVGDCTVYFNLNNPNHEIAKITPGSIEILKNGGNDDGVILDGSRKWSPFDFCPRPSRTRPTSC
jgi:DNA primase